MEKIIAPDLVIGNAFISTGKEKLSKNEIIKYCYILNELLPKGFIAEIKVSSFEYFIAEYSFLTKKVDDNIIINCDKEVLVMFFRMGLQTPIIEAFDKAAIKLNVEDLKETKKEKVFTKKR